MCKYQISYDTPRKLVSCCRPPHHSHIFGLLYIVIPETRITCVNLTSLMWLEYLLLLPVFPDSNLRVNSINGRTILPDWLSLVLFKQIYIHPQQISAIDMPVRVITEDQHFNSRLQVSASASDQGHLPFICRGWPCRFDLQMKAYQVAFVLASICLVHVSEAANATTDPLVRL